MTGPLAGLRVVELAGIGPGPHAAMVLADLGADVVRVERPVRASDILEGQPDQQLRGRRVVTADFKIAEDLEQVRGLIEHADVLIEGYRPGVAERVGLGPEELLELNPGLVYARMTGWGQSGPRASQAGHDINYISSTGALHAIGRDGERPVVPLNLVGDFGGGSMFCVTGILAALYERQSSGKGQVIDVAMVDGAALLMQMMWAYRAGGIWVDQRESNILDGGAPFYDTYNCRDGKHIAVGAIEEPFYRMLCQGLGLDPDALPPQMDRARWPELRRCFADVFATADRDHWTEIFDGTDACVSPVLSMEEALEDPHLRSRETFTFVDGVPQPAPAPRFSRSVAQKPVAPVNTPETLESVYESWSATR